MCVSVCTCACVGVCVCVSTPVPKGFHLTVAFRISFSAGGSRVCSWREPTKLQIQTRISKEDALSTYLQPELLTTLSNLLCLIPWFFMLPPPKPWFLQLHRAARFATAEFCRHEKQLLFKHLQFLGPFAMRFSHLPSTWELHNCKPMSECDSLSRPTWVLSVIPVTGALNSCRTFTNSFFRFHRSLVSPNRLGFTTELYNCHYAAGHHGIST